MYNVSVSVSESVSVSVSVSVIVMRTKYKKNSQWPALKQKQKREFLRIQLNYVEFIAFSESAAGRYLFQPFQFQWASERPRQRFHT